jgi:hypothetical protein
VTFSRLTQTEDQKKKKQEMMFWIKSEIDKKNKK